MATLYENFSSADVDSEPSSANYWNAQTFTPQISHTISYIKVYIWKNASPTGVFNFPIWGVDGSSHPSGGTLCTGTLEASALQASANWETVTFTSQPSLTASTEYAMICDYEGAVGQVRWQEQYPENLYARGHVEITADAGSSWTSYTNRDFMFEEWGDPITTAETKRKHLALLGVG